MTSPHVPQRQCVGCRQRADKRSLVRVVRAAGRLAVDRAARMPGRGSYVHATATCVTAASRGPMQKLLGRALHAGEVAALASIDASAIGPGHGAVNDFKGLAGSTEGVSSGQSAANVVEPQPSVLPRS